MSNPILKRRLQIVIALFFAFVIVRSVSTSAFLSNTPRVNKKFFADLRALPQMLPNLIQSGSQKIITMVFPPKGYSVTDSKQNQNTMAETIKKLPVASMLPVSKGVYAFQDSASKVVYIHLTKDAENSLYTERTATINGEQVTFRFPKE